VTDPINYAPHWYAEKSHFGGQQPLDVLLFSGMDDAQTPFTTAEAMAGAARMPQLAPAVTSPDSQTLRGLGPQEGPLRDNAPAFDGHVTAAFSQWDDRDHFVIFKDQRATRIYREFLRSAAQGEPTIGHLP
jgi:hypothetical protein